MAERKTQTSNKSTGRSTGKSAPRSRSKKAIEQEELRRREEAMKKSARRHHITSVILFAVGIFMTIAAIIPGAEGEGWRVVFDIMHGLFGYSAYLIGPLMIYIAVLVSANRSKKKLIGIVVKSSAGVLLLCAAVQIFVIGATPGENFGEVIVNLFNDAKEFRGGGVFSIIIGGPLLLLGQLGAGIIIVLVALVFFLIIFNITVVDMLHKVSKPIKKAKDVTVEHHRRLKEETALAEAEYERREQEELERKRLLAEIDAEQEEKKAVQSLIRAVHSVEKDDPPAPLDTEPDTTGVQINVAEEKPEPPNILQEQHEDNVDYMREIRDYIMEKNKATIDAANELKKDPLEDENAELIPVIEAIHSFKEEHHEPTQIKEIVDAPVKDMLSSDDGELPFDLDDDDINEPIPEMIHQPKQEAPAAPIAVKPAEKPSSAPVPVQETQATSNNEAHESSGNMMQYKLSDLYTLPPISLLNPVEKKLTQDDIDLEIDRNSHTLVETLKSFGVQTKIVGVSRGPSVTRYELQPAPGVKISKITNLVDDIALNLAAAGVRIEAPIPNKAAVGIEVPNKQKDTVYFRELVDTKEFKKSFDRKLETALGKDIGGNMVTCNVAKMPHLLIAGTTGSGKSVCVNSIIMSILMKSTPDDVRLIMVDPKKVEFMMYNGIPHLLIPVVTDPKKAAGALAWAVNEMLNRYKLFSENNVRDFGGYNELAADPNSGLKKMSHIVIFIDELADLMLASPKDVEDSIVRLAQMARAAGMHLVIATQRPTVNVVTGLIKANIPSRIALMVASQMDSRVILDVGGAEKLLGNGDMLYMPVGMPKPQRVQGCYVSDKEVERTVEFIKQTFEVHYDENIMEEIERQSEMVNSADSKGGASSDSDIDESDEKLEEAIELVVTAGVASTSSLQRALKLGYGRAARLIDTMEKMGVVGPFEGSKPRQVLMTKEEWYERKLRQ